MNGNSPKANMCAKCGKDFDAQFDVCPFCGEAVSEHSDGKMSDDKHIKPNRKKTRILAVAILLSVVAACVIIVLEIFQPLKPKDNFSDAELAEIFDDINYSALTATTEYRFKAIKNGYVIDADKDGRKELFLEIESEQYPDKTTVLAFDTIENPIMSSVTHNGKAGDASIKLSSDNSVILEYGYYTMGITQNSIEKWSNNGWDNIGKFIGHLDGDDELVVEAANLNGVDFDTQEEFDSEFDKLGVNEHTEFYGELLSKYYSTNNGITLAEKYNQYLSEKFKEGCLFKTEDFDGDGDNEYAYVIKNFAGAWCDNLKTAGTDGYIMEDYISGIENTGTVFIYADSDKNGIVFHTFAIDDSEETNGYADTYIDVSWSDGELNAFVNNVSNDFFCMNADMSNYGRLSDDSYKKIGKMFTSFLKRNYYEDVISKYVSLSDFSGKDLVCICDGFDWTTKIYTVANGRVINVYQQDTGRDGAVYITTENGENSLLCYNQSVFRDGSRNANSYTYSIKRFDDGYNLQRLNGKTVTVYYDEPPTEEKSKFFTEFNGYLNGAEVCVDRYELTGYSKMITDNSDYFDSNNEKYLSISNCNTNKTGTVNVDEGSWLNFRDGASVAYDRILLNADDPNSFVKQIRGSAVTVIDTANIEDTENPIWLKIQIKYADQTLTGFSSKAFIDLPEIKHLSVGDKFTVTAKTNDKGLKWSSSDSDILTIDSDSGAAKAKKQGLVSVKVISDSGLEDSCLVMVD